MSRRIYVDTSVIGGCLDVEFRTASGRLMDDFRRGEAMMVLSDLTERERRSAPPAVRSIARTVPSDHLEHVRLTDAAIELAEEYIAAGAIGAAHRIDAQHIAVATVSHVDTLASWNFRHIVNGRRIRTYNAVNVRYGYGSIEIQAPSEVIIHGKADETV